MRKYEILQKSFEWGVGKSEECHFPKLDSVSSSPPRWMFTTYLLALGKWEITKNRDIDGVDIGNRYSQ